MMLLTTENKEAIKKLQAVTHAALVDLRIHLEPRNSILKWYNLALSGNEAHAAGPVEIQDEIEQSIAWFAFDLGTEHKISRSEKPKKLTFAQIPEFDGTRSHFRGWIKQLGVKFAQEVQKFPDDDARIRYAFTLLRGSAREVIDGRFAVNGTHTYKSYAEFYDDLNYTFGDPDEARTAAAQLKNLKQTGACSIYTQRFIALSRASGVLNADSQTINQYEEGLKPALRSALSIQPSLPTTWDEFTNLCISIDQRMHRLQEERRQTASAPVRPVPQWERPQNMRPNRPQHFQTPWQRPQLPPPPKPSPAPASVHPDDRMQIDHLRTMNPRERRDHCRKYGLCNYCMKPGHVVRNCPNGARMAQVNQVTLTDAIIVPPTAPQHDAVSVTTTEEQPKNSSLQW